MDRTPIESNAKFMQKSRGYFLMGHSLLKKMFELSSKNILWKDGLKAFDS